MSDNRRPSGSRSPRRRTPRPRREEGQATAPRESASREPRESSRESKESSKDHQFRGTFDIEGLPPVDEDLDDYQEEREAAPRNDRESGSRPREARPREDREPRESRENYREPRDSRPPREQQPRNEGQPRGSYNRPDFNQPSNPTDPYTVQLHFDKSSRSFVATILEVPEIKSTGTRREETLDEVLDKLETHMESTKRRGGQIAEPVSARTYPDKLSIPISQSLYRRLDQLSRHEKVALDQLVTELLSGAIERRFEPQKSGHSHGHDRREQRHQQQGGGNQRHQGGNRRQNMQGGRNRYNDTMQNRENFMEYVRNLEKSGGGSGNWRKK